MAKTIVSNFKHDAQGWTMQGDVASSGFQAHGGNPGGFFHWVDAASGSDSYYVAPTAYTGDKHAFYGATLSYDIEDTGSDAAGIPDVELVGTNGTTLVATLGQAGTDWTHFSIELATGNGWHVGTLDGAAATKADFKGVLADLSKLLIRAEYVNGNESGGLDNVVLAKSVPAAAAHAFGADSVHPHAHDLAAVAPFDHHHLAIV